MGSFTKDPRWSTLELAMRTLALILLSSLLCCCYAQTWDPPAGQRCRGRNYDGKRCCTPEQPCGLGEGDCDGPLDGGVNDGHRGCKGDLVCGSNNCKQFGAYYHEKDDCCERPTTGGPGERYPTDPSSGWGPWGPWRCAAPGTLEREQKCTKRECSLNNGRVGTRNTQQRYSDT